MAPVVHLASNTERAPRPLPVLTRISLAELIVLQDRLGNPALPIDLDGGTGAHAADHAAGRLHARLADGAPPTGQRARGLVGAALERARTKPAATAVRLAALGLIDGNGTPAGDVVAAFGVLAAPRRCSCSISPCTRTRGPPGCGHGSRSPAPRSCSCRRRRG